MEPKARWVFLVKNYIIWIIAFVALIVGAVSFAVALEIIQNSGMDLYASMEHGSAIGILLHTLPLVWLLLLGVFAGLAYVQIRKTKRGYKYAFPIVIIGGAAIMIGFGVAFFTQGVGDKTDEALSKVVPHYKTILNRNEMFWHRPHKGYLVGRIYEVDDDNEIIVVDVQKHTWEVEVEEAKIIGAVQLAPGVFVRVVGMKTDDDEFKASLIGPAVHVRTQKIRVRQGRPAYGKPLELKNERKNGEVRNTKYNDVGTLK